MLHIQDPAVKALLLKGNFGLEKENLRVTQEIRRKFCGKRAGTGRNAPENHDGEEKLTVS